MNIAIAATSICSPNTTCPATAPGDRDDRARDVPAGAEGVDPEHEEECGDREVEAL